MYDSYTQKYMRIFIMVACVVLIGVGVFKIYRQQLDYAMLRTQKNIEVINLETHIGSLRDKIEVLKAQVVSPDEVFFPLSYGDNLANFENRLVQLMASIDSSPAGTDLIPIYDSIDEMSSTISSRFEPSSTFEPLWLQSGDGNWVFMTNHGLASPIVPSLWVREADSSSVSDKRYTGYASADFDGHSTLFSNMRAYGLHSGTIYSVM